LVKRYLQVISLDDALALIDKEVPRKVSSARVPLMASVGRVTASPIYAANSVPEVHLAAMDGIAVQSSETVGASDQNPVILPDAVMVNTGGVVPEGYDAVVMIEDVWRSGDQFIVRKAVSPWQHIRPAGEDITQTEMVLPSFHAIRPHEIGALAAYGVSELDVIEVSVGLIPTGSELVPSGTRPLPGQVVESNTAMAEAMLIALGASCTRYPIVPDDPDAIMSAVSQGAAAHDLLIVSAGSSAGTRDFTAQVIAELGTVLAHGVAIKPGKPVIIGRVGSTPVVGMPGYPLSALTILREVLPRLLSRFGLPRRTPEEIEAVLSSTIASDLGIDEFVFVAVGKVAGRWVAAPLSRGAGVQMSAVRANGVLSVPASSEGYEAGSSVRVRLMVERAQVDSALLITGSHDPALDILSDLLAQEGFEAHSAHTGSMGGLIALGRRECHAAPTHLLGPDGEYNTSFVRRIIPGEEIVLVSVAGRAQGIVSRDGLGFDAITTHRFINRQKGSGTRLLLDYLLTKEGISHEKITGYSREVTTHLAVALAVKSGEADMGMCVKSAAFALDLPFVPVADERYELAIRTSDWDDIRIRALVQAIDSVMFQEALHALGGYDTSISGKQRRLP
jgi:putative molybdopterin biosynthesis protein